MFWAIDWFVIFALSTIVTAASLNINIRPVKDEYIHPLGSSTVLTCEVTGRSESPVRIQWLDKTRLEIPEDTSKGVYVERTDRMLKKLYITNMVRNDSGRYYCVVSDGSPLKLNKSIDLIIFKDITFDHVPNPQHPAIHTDAIIECQVSGQPEPQVSWKYNKKSLPLGNRYSMVRNGLRIRNITLADDGNYTCCAEVDADGRYGDQTITVAVHIPPSRVEFSGNFEEVEGRNISLSCTARGLPSPKFEFHREHRGKLSSSTDRVVIDADGGRLSFRPAKKEDEGLYTCMAINDVGSNSTTKRITVFVPPKIYDLTNVTKSERETGILVCRSHGDPRPTIEFHKEGNLYPFVMGSNDEGRVYISKKPEGHLELTIRSLTPSDAANYTCASRNSAGYDNRTGVIDVHYKPRFDKDHKTLVYGWAGTRHNMTCHVHAQPMPTIKWLRYGRILENNETFVIYNSERHSILQVRIKEADQSWIYGLYICRAENSKGTADQSIHLNRATVPSAPVFVKNKEISPNQVLLQVDPPRENGGVQVTGYRVEFESIIQDVSITGNLAVEADDAKTNRFWFNNFTAAELSIDNLRPGTKYVFRIRAKNDVGVGNEFEHIVTTANLTNPYPIKLTSPLTSVNSRSYRITWERPKTGGIAISGYEFRYRKVRTGVEELRKRSDEEEWKSVYVEDVKKMPLLEYTLRGLTPVTEYQLQVLASNGLGTSTPNEKFFFWTSEGGDSEPTQMQASVSPAAGIGIAVAIFLIILIIVDISCYFLNGCGFTMFVCVHLCEKLQPKNENEDLETGDSKVILKQPLQQFDAGKTGHERDVAELQEVEEGTDDVTAPLRGSHTSEDDDVKSASNRKSILSQGDERWKDVVQELEKELSIKRSLSENESHEKREKPEIVVSDDKFFAEPDINGKIPEEENETPQTESDEPEEEEVKEVASGIVSAAVDPSTDNEESKSPTDENEHTSLPEIRYEDSSSVLGSEDEKLPNEEEEEDEERKSQPEHEEERMSNRVGEEKNSLHDHDDDERQSLIEEPQIGRDLNIMPIGANWDNSFLQDDDDGLDRGTTGADDKRPLLDENLIANTDFNEDSAESMTDQPAGDLENELIDEPDTF